MNNKGHETLEDELNQAAKKVKVGGIYYHYKNPNNYYKVVGLGIQEATDKICVLYQAEYNKKLTFVRDLGSWLENPEFNVSRFSLVDD
jgi:hypothetical protein